MVLVQQSSLLGHNGPVTIDPGVSCALEHQGAPGPAMRALCGASEGLRAVVRPGGAQRPGLLRVCPQEHAVDGARR